MKDLAMTLQGNTFIAENKRWRFTENRLEYLSQKIRHTISIFQGEWFLDREIGIPYIPGENIDKSLHRRMIETALQVRIGEIDGVERFVSFSSHLDKSTRILAIDFTVQIDTGETYSHSVMLGV
jgi:hypothetical protein